ncbi:nuclear transport factor 2 family protein [Aurantivibrio plasticivorans]
MNKILCLIFLILLSIATSAQASQKDGNGMTPNDFIKAYETAISNQRWEQVESLIHDDCVVTFTNGTYRGKPQVE